MPKCRKIDNCSKLVALAATARNPKATSQERQDANYDLSQLKRTYCSTGNEGGCDLYVYCNKK